VALNQQANIHFLYGKGNEKHVLGRGFFVHKRIISEVKWVEFLSDRMSYIILRSCSRHIIVLNVHAPREDITDDMKDRFHKEIEHIFDKFPNTV
jgi:hypothetical protein